MVPWIVMCKVLSQSEKKFSEIINPIKKNFPSSGEINFRVLNKDELIKKIEKKFTAGAEKVDKCDGLSIEYSDWRFNIRKSNTEDLVRLNLETKGNKRLLLEKVDKISAIIKEFGTDL